MTIEKFTIKAQEVVQQAVNIARQNGQQSIEPVHLLKALMDKAQDITSFIFQKLGVNVQQLDMLASQEMQHLARVQGGSKIAIKKLPSPQAGSKKVDSILNDSSLTKSSIALTSRSLVNTSPWSATLSLDLI